MSITAERFAQGMTYDEFKAGMTRNQERFDTNERAVVLDTADMLALEGLAQQVSVMVLAEDWCGDVIDNLPVLGILAAASDKLNVRIFLRDQNLDLMDQYLNQGEFRSIPVFVFFDTAFNELGRLIERPATVTARRAELRKQLSAEHPDLGSPETPVAQLPEEARVKLMSLMADARAKQKAQDNGDVISAFRAILASR